MKALAMKCTQEQFDKIKPILLNHGLEIYHLDSFTSHPYLINNKTGDLGVVTNVVRNIDPSGYNRGVFEEWNELTFLSYCDITSDKVDFSIKGTKIPTVPRGTHYRCFVWNSNNEGVFFNREHPSLISFGLYAFRDETYVLCEDSSYTGVNYYMIKLSTIEELVKTYPTGLKSKEKEIIGYKLIKPEYLGAVKTLVGDWWSENADNNLKVKGWHLSGSEAARSNGRTSLLSKAGVLDLWFEPVYEEVEEIINIGFDIKIKAKRAYHKNDDITDFVIKLVEDNNTVVTYSGYSVVRKEVVFVKTGCETVETTLSDWMKVYNKVRNLK